MRLPELTSAALDPDRYRRLRADPAAWLPAVQAICAAHGLESEAPAPFADGANLVAAVDERWVVKVFPPFHRHQYESEHRALAHLRGRDLPLRVPTLLAHGVRDDGWAYVIQERLAGELLERRWSTLGADERSRVLAQIGELMAAVHRVPLGPLASLPPEWSGFLAAQREACRRRHERLGAPRWVIAGVDDLARTWGPSEGAGDRVLLTGEYTPFNLLGARGLEGWRLTGMIDFGDAMVGPREYDLLGPSLFLCGGESELLESFLRAYHAESRAIDREFGLRLLALAALHRYADFDVQVRVPRWRERAGSMEELAALIWPH